MNSRGITCIRYVDDFIVTGRTRKDVTRSMEAAKALLGNLKMDIYDPSKSPKKAFIGQIGEPHVFLGYKLLPGNFPPADAACERLMDKIEILLAKGKRSISKAVTDRALTNQDQCYAQTIVSLDHVVRGWRTSFRASDCPEVFRRIDKDIDRRLSNFKAFYLQKVTKRTPALQRRALRVHLLSE